MRNSFRRRAGWRAATVAAAFAVLAGALLLPVTPAAALDSEIDSGGFARLVVPDVVAASELWVEVEAPTLNAGNIVLMNGGAEVALRSTALGAGAILAYDGTSIELAVGVTVAASPDVAITVLGTDGAVLFSAHSRIALPPSAGGVSPTPDGSDPAAPQPGAVPGDDPGRTAVPVAKPGGVLGATGSDPFAYLVFAMLATALGAAGIVAARKQARR
jgi:hypothetical protein